MNCHSFTKRIVHGGPFGRWPNPTSGLACLQGERGHAFAVKGRNSEQPGGRQARGVLESLHTSRSPVLWLGLCFPFSPFPASLPLCIPTSLSPPLQRLTALLVVRPPFYSIVLFSPRPGGSQRPAPGSLRGREPGAPTPFLGAPTTLPALHDFAVDIFHRGRSRRLLCSIHKRSSIQSSREKGAPRRCGGGESFVDRSDQARGRRPGHPLVAESGAPFLTWAKGRFGARSCAERTSADALSWASFF